MMYRMNTSIYTQEIAAPAYEGSVLNSLYEGTFTTAINAGASSEEVVREVADSIVEYSKTQLDSKVLASQQENDMRALAGVDVVKFSKDLQSRFGGPSLSAEQSIGRISIKIIEALWEKPTATAFCL